jgi:hypothetical protein
MKLHLGLAALLVWTGVTGFAVADCGDDDPFGGSGGSGCQNIQADDDPGGSECDGALQVTSVASGALTLDVGLFNPASKSESGYIVVTVVMDGQLLTFAQPVVVSATSTMAFQFIFPEAITPVGIDVCSKKPGGIVETPDPVTVVREPSEEEAE